MDRTNNLNLQVKLEHETCLILRLLATQAQWRYCSLLQSVIFLGELTFVPKGKPADDIETVSREWSGLQYQHLNLVLHLECTRKPRSSLDAFGDITGSRTPQRAMMAESHYRLRKRLQGSSESEKLGQLLCVPIRPKKVNREQRECTDMTGFGHRRPVGEVVRVIFVCSDLTLLN